MPGMTKQDRVLLARMKDIRELLAEFNAVLHGYDPGVTANIAGKPLSFPGIGAGYWGEHLAFDATEWLWLEPLLKELRDHRKRSLRDAIARLIRELEAEKLPDADLRVPREFKNWVDDTPAAQQALHRIGVRWTFELKKRGKR